MAVNYVKQSILKVVKQYSTQHLFISVFVHTNLLMLSRVMEANHILSIPIRTATIEVKYLCRVNLLINDQVKFVFFQN
jgi:hypothetical protein